MARKTLTAVSPKYMATFRCVGPACQDHCCHGWVVTIDKATFKRYRAVTDEVMADRLKKGVRRLTGPEPTTAAYAAIRLKPDGTCPFLAQDRLCDIQRQMGEKALSATCKQYPRSFLSEGEAISVYATLSCPEAARLALLDAEAMAPTAHELDFAHEGSVPAPLRIPSNLTKTGTPLQRAHLALRNATLDILDNPVVSAVEAALLIGLMTRRIVGYGKSIKDATAAGVYEIFTSPEAAADVGRHVAALSTDLRIQMLMLKEISVEWFLTSRGGPAFRRELTLALAGFGYSDNDLPGSLSRYRTAAGWFIRFNDKHPHILRNYLTNEIRKSLFPFGNQGPEEQFFWLAIRLGLIQMYLIGQAGQLKENFHERCYVNVIYSFSRSIEHNAKFRSHVMKLLRDNGYLNMGMMATLLKAGA